MRSKLFFSALLVWASSLSLYAQDPKPYQTGKLLQMDSVPCSPKASQSLCHEYVLESDSVVFHIRPTHAKSSTLLRVGERAQFRIDSGKLFLRMEGVDNRERQYAVISISPRSETDTANAAGPVHLNHLQ